MRVEDPDLLFLIETRLCSFEFEATKRGIGMTHGIIVNCEGRSGGLALLLKRDVDVTVVSYLRFHIEAKGDEGRSSEWRLVGFNRHLMVSKRKHAWDLLKYLKSKSNMPWLCIRDFNEIS